jgi:hypothetical protein
VWEVIEPVETHVQWMADASEIRFIGAQRDGVGARFECDTKVGPIRLTDRMRITQWQPAVAMGVAHEGLIRGSGRFTLAPAGQADRTRFTWSERLQFPWYLGGGLGAMVAARLVLTPIWRANLRRLGALVVSAERPRQPEDGI